ncbi:sugar phosphate isomerase/epimerase family protein [Jeotgalibacillus soli]|uniref:Xylose isomerase n=1 Tax=Jeotgalibacillus soli TaxID=889306 RepID=A0A0C2RH52_9BACL|nr:sugar phosphate isomerase/epimerase [Jeotgalibacillus soli]KIL49490.1 xylose isomerase [Jeotgalibacillus soli]
MKLGIFTVLFSQMELEEMLKHVKEAGVGAVEIGTGGYPGDAHCNIDELLDQPKRQKEYLALIEKYELTISAFSCHGNPISPDKTFAAKCDEDLRKTIRLAAQMGVPVVNTFSGVPGDSENSQYPNWPVAPWPGEYGDLLEWQWKEKLIPYWQDIANVAKEHNVKIGLELHGGFLVHTPYTLLKLREATNEYIGANLDPSHLWWQGIDPVGAIKILGKENALHHFHAKDTYLDQDNINMYGLTDMQSYSKIQSRAWNFRSVGCGHSMEEWTNIISALKTYGYDYVVSIEHEDPLMSINEGFATAVSNLDRIIIKDASTDMWWV